MTTTATRKKVSSQFLAVLVSGNLESKGGAFTVKSNATQKDYTFKISRKEFHGRYYSHVKVEKQYLNFTYLGTYKNGQLYDHGKIVETDAAKAASWLMRQLEQKKFDKVDQSVTLYHLGKCLKCGKTLTDSISIEAGIGPVCRNMV